MPSTTPVSNSGTSRTQVRDAALPTQDLGVSRPAARGTAIAYIAGRFPQRSETFVYREVRALRQRGWIVQTVSLHDPSEGGFPGMEDLEDGSLIVYGRGLKQTAVAALLETLAHPFQSIRTLALAARDAIAPGEALRFGGRLKLLGQAAAGIGLGRRLRQRSVRSIHCHFAHAPTSIGMYTAAHLGVPFSFTGHANDLFQRRSLLRRKLERAAFVSCISAWHREFYEQVFQDRDKSGPAYPIIRCGVDVTNWRPRDRKSLPVQAASALKVLTVCRLVEKKGVDQLVRAVAELSRRHGNAWQLTVAGDGPDRAALQELAKQCRCEAQVHWLGPIDNERVPQLMGSADVFALPCRTDARGDRDGIPVVLMEAMACGLPVVAGDLPAIRELIEDGSSGLLVDGADLNALIRGLETLAAIPELRQQLAASGRQRVEQEFSLDINIDRLERALLDAT